MAERIASGDRQLLERLGLDTGGFAFNMLSVIHTATRGETVEDVATALLDRLRHALEERSYKTTEIRWELDLKLFKLGGTAAPTIVPRIVDQLIDSIELALDRLARDGHNGLLLMVDEIDRVTRVETQIGSDLYVPAGFGSFFKVFAEKLATRGLKNVGICVCGVEGFLQELKAEHASIERIFRDVPIPPLTNPQAEQIIIDALAGVSVEIDEPARRTIVRLSGNYPEPVHLIGSEAFRVDTDDFIDENDVEAALDQVVRYVRRNYLKDILRRANSGRDQEILRAMAAMDGETKAVRDVADRLGIESFRFGSNMTRLTRRNVLTRERPGFYRFTEPLLEIYIQRVGLGAVDDTDQDDEQAGS
jgi:hypothetical protein